MKLWLLALRAAWSVPDCRGQTASPLSPAYLEPGVEAQPTRRSADAISPEGIGADVPVAREHEDVSAIGGTLWEALDESSVAELPAYKEVVEERALIRVTDAAAGWIVGQRIAIPVPQINEVYTPVIERIEPGPSGVRSYVGTLTEVAGRPHRFTITVGPRNMFGQLSTPQGTFELVATGELGWLMPTANMDQHVDYSVPDFVIPEGPEFLEALR